MMFPRKGTSLIVLCPIIIIIHVIADSNCVVTFYMPLIVLPTGLAGA
jgi:hypothetical protein